MVPIVGDVISVLTELNDLLSKEKIKQNPSLKSWFKEISDYIKDWVKKNRS